MLRCLLASILLLALLGCAQPPVRRQIADVAAVPQARGNGTRSFHYLVSLPTGYAGDEKRRWPLLVYLPGVLSVGSDPGILTRGGPPYEIEMGRELPMVVFSPMTPAAFEPWTPHKVIALIDYAIERYRVNPGRVYLTGLSLGGRAVWDAAMAYPDRFAAVAPVCAYGDPCGIERMADVPVWAFHGAIDFAVLPPFHTRMVNALRAAGGKPRYTLIPWGFHWIWDEVYSNDALYEWMLEHSLPLKAEAPKGR